MINKLRLVVFALLATAVRPLAFADESAGDGGGDTYIAHADGDLGPTDSDPIQAASFDAAEERLEGQLEEFAAATGVVEQVESITDETTGETREYRPNSE